MSVTTTIPVDVSDEAATYITALGMQAEFAQLVEKALTIPGLRRLEVSLFPDYEGIGDEDIVLDATCDEAFDDEKGTEQRAFGAWKVRTFPPAVSQHFCLLTVYPSS